MSAEKRLQVVEITLDTKLEDIPDGPPCMVGGKSTQLHQRYIDEQQVQSIYFFVLPNGLLAKKPLDRD
ncbi:MAG: hypothetical protein UU73_C0002G0180 [Candidatus Daviesbacteria bacterium GW2011_GWA1_41_61]|uniref:Uncharacterized protein n=1 Tax=Candidatus Daviesbacteria bacterium GW2011_GWA2_40_9 TaxID=1618424 RepID=A0A0G0U2Y1_9BACT|nr:MAG: hypothetical protein UU26_C0009G0021 [Candidatus Daviesbacteria bacterium GW2011_GWC1_40_9]KKR83458.1 MAG: hypothetical protein UU29_C0005G0039 [Candidatus Daviesbacteria bacterium GW2011_GWA2_40_9]KKR93840.1 MAG: hypothetical protein UU44_C0001G0180 [Candidatus Daviesbacteria bacterium GW2011_GWB1_41_15]KKS15306.1 MAG: hypothetical protein UU73_C0002G0180 [Candidatus Daviesbacteria bacterium GW2011_GWA1_41_61]